MVMALTGQTFTQRPQRLHSSLKTNTRSFRKMAFWGQEPTQAPQ
jgi:hypothetical protein